GVGPYSRPSTKTRAPAGVERTRTRPLFDVAAGVPVGRFPPAVSPLAGRGVGGAGGDAGGGDGFGDSLTALSVNSRPAGGVAGEVAGALCALAIGGETS